jgi:hypothetical protein
MKKMFQEIRDNTLRLFVLLENGTAELLGEISPLDILMGTEVLQLWVADMCKLADKMPAYEEPVHAEQSAAGQFFNDDGTMRHLKVQKMGDKVVWWCTALKGKTLRQKVGKFGSVKKDVEFFTHYIATANDVDDESTLFLLRHGVQALAQQALKINAQ